MDELDMRPGTELFPEQAPQNYNSYEDVNQDQLVLDPLDTGVTQPDVAGQVQLSDKEMNFRALREEAAKLKEEREYWKGQAEAYLQVRQPEMQQPQQDALSALDWDDSRDVRKAFETLKGQNENLSHEMKDALKALDTKAQHQDWNSKVTQNVPQLTSKNKLFAEMIQNVSNPYEAAYLLAELNERASQPQQPTPGYNPGNGQRALTNAQKPQTIASVGGQGQLSSADYYASMSDEDFMKIAARNMANI